MFPRRLRRSRQCSRSLGCGAPLAALRGCPPSGGDLPSASEQRRGTRPRNPLIEAGRTTCRPRPGRCPRTKSKESSGTMPANELVRELAPGTSYRAVRAAQIELVVRRHDGRRHLTFIGTSLLAFRTDRPAPKKHAESAPTG